MSAANRASENLNRPRRSVGNQTSASMTAAQVLTQSCSDSCVFEKGGIVTCEVRLRPARLIDTSLPSCRTAAAEFSRNNTLKISLLNSLSTELDIDWVTALGRSHVSEVTLRGRFSEGSVTSMLSATAPTLEKLTLSCCYPWQQCAGCGLRAIPAALASATNLTYLSLASNQIRQVSSTVLGKLSKLTLLSLHANEIEDLPLDAFESQSNLAILFLTRNRLKSITPQHLQSLGSLRTLGIGANKLTALSKELFDRVANLEWLDFSFNRLKSFAPLSLSSLQNLKALGIGRTNGAVSLELLTTLSSLVMLDASDNSITSLPDLTHITKLEFLNVSSNALQSMSGLPSSLTFLNISHNPGLTIPTSLLLNSSLNILDISNTRVALEPMETPLCSWPILSRRMSLLQARGLVKTDDTASVLHNIIASCLPRVSLLDVSSNHISSLARLTQALDAVKFFFSMYSGDSQESDTVSQLQLGRDSPVQCDLQREDAARLVENAWTILPSLAFACSCSPSYEQGSHGDCSPRPEYWTAGKIAGLIIGVMLFSCVIMGGIVLYVLRLRRTQMDLELSRRLLEDTQEEVVLLKRVWELLPSEVSLEKRIDLESPGAFGEVWRGRWQDLTVAVKMLQQGVMDMDAAALEEFHKEVEFMQRTRHQNIVRFYGAGTWADGRPFFVVELVSNGSLKSFLRGRGNEERAVPWVLKVSLVLDIAQGMEHIHGLGQMHRDLKTGNVLITDQNRAKIADFGTVRQLIVESHHRRRRGQGQRQGHGSSRVTSTSFSEAADPQSSGSGASSLELTAGKGTPLYMSPEVMRGKDYDHMADVWSFGVILWEVAAQRSPDLLEQEGGGGRGPLLFRLLGLLEQGKRLMPRREWAGWYVALMQMCWDASVRQRPSFSDIVSKLQPQHRELVEGEPTE